MSYARFGLSGRKCLMPIGRATKSAICNPGRFALFFTITNAAEFQFHFRILPTPAALHNEVRIDLALLGRKPCFLPIFSHEGTKTQSLHAGNGLSPLWLRAFV